jgi:hypothetical protein
MHRFLVAFLCLSTLAMAQNVVAGTPSALREGQAGMTVEAVQAGLASGVDLTRSTAGGEVPSPGTLLLLVTGLAGLSAVGGDRRASAVRAASR